MERPTRNRAPAKPRPPKFSERYFHNVATGYLKQRMTTSMHLKKLLMQRVRKAAEALAVGEGAGDGEESGGSRAGKGAGKGTGVGGATRAELERQGEGWVDAVIADLAASGALNDTSYATAKAAGVQARGGSERKVAAKLASKGMGREQVREVIASIREEQPNAEIAAAVALVRRKRLGPMRPPGERRAMSQKDLGVLARAGFSFDLAKRVLGVADEEELEGLLEG